VNEQQAQDLARQLANDAASERLAEGEAVTLREDASGWLLSDEDGEPAAWWVVVESEAGNAHAVREEDAAGGRDSVWLHVAPGVCFAAS
jgi:hypothetical protein